MKRVGCLDAAATVGHRLSRGVIKSGLITHPFEKKRVTRSIVI